MEEIIKEIEEFKKGKSKEETKLIDDLINHLKTKKVNIKLSSEFGPKNSTKCPQCGK
jgi:hypothetical protein